MEQNAVVALFCGTRNPTGIESVGLLRFNPPQKGVIGVFFYLGFFEPLSAFLATRPSFVPDDIVFTADRTLVSVGVIVRLPPHIQTFLQAFG
jgi:hypothetical protein